MQTDGAPLGNNLSTLPEVGSNVMFEASAGACLRDKRGDCTMAVKTKTKFDVVLRGGRVIDPARKIDRRMDIAVRDGKIAAMEESLPVDAAKKKINVAGKLVLPGLIDVHGHVCEYITALFGVSPDFSGVRSGATAVVDQGTVSAFTFPAFKKYVVEPAATNVYAFVSIYSGGGLYANLNLNFISPQGIDADVVIETIKANRDVIKGIKVQVEAGTYSRYGLETLKIAKQTARKVGVPIYMHLGHLFSISKGKKFNPEQIVREAVKYLDAGDIIAHPFSRDPGAFVMSNGKVNPGIFEALDKGCYVDVGRGSHFSFDVARQAAAQGIVPTTCGADLHGLNVMPGRYLNTRQKMIETGIERTRARRAETPGSAQGSNVSAISLCGTMTELMAIGYPLIEVIRMATSNAAKITHIDRQHGTLRVGRPADISVVTHEKGHWTLQDFYGSTVKATERLVPAFVLREGKVIESDVRVPERVQRKSSTPLVDAYDQAAE